MESKVFTKNQLLAIGGGATLLLGVGYLIKKVYFKKPKSKRNYLLRKNRFTRVDVISVFKRIQRNMFPLLEHAEQHFQKIKQKNQNATHKEIYIKLIKSDTNYSKIKAKINSMSYKYFGLYGPKIAFFSRFINKLKQTDQELKSIVAGLQFKVKEICTGKKVDLDIQLPLKITSDTMLELYKAVNYKAIQSKINIYIDLKDEKLDQEDKDLLQSAVMDPKHHYTYIYEYAKLYDFDCSDEFCELYVYKAALKQLKDKDEKFRIAINKIDEIIVDIEFDLGNPDNNKEDLLKKSLKMIDVDL
jgi:hypothetical protein